MSEAALRDAISKYIECYNSFYIDEMIDLFEENCIFQNVSNSSGTVECKGKEPLRSFAKQNASMFQERQQIITNWIVSNNKVAVEVDFSAKMACDFPTGLKKGDHIECKGMSVFEFESGKIKRLVDFS